MCTSPSNYFYDASHASARSFTPPLARLIRKTRILAFCAAGGVLAALSACSSMPPPNEQLAVSRSAIDQAQRSGAGDEASEQLGLAQRKLNEALAAQQKGNYKLAAQLAEEAEADALLAQARAASIKSQKAVEEVRKSINTLQQELNRPAN